MDISVMMRHPLGVDIEDALDSSSSRGRVRCRCDSLRHADQCMQTVRACSAYCALSDGSIPSGGSSGGGSIGGSASCVVSSGRRRVGGRYSPCRVAGSRADGFHRIGYRPTCALGRSGSIVCRSDSPASGCFRSRRAGGGSLSDGCSRRCCSGGMPGCRGSFLCALGRCGNISRGGSAT